MGYFFSMSCIAQSDTKQVENGIRDFIAWKGGQMTQLPGGNVSTEENVMVVAESAQNNVTVLYSSSFTDHEAICAHLSEFLSRPVFYLHTHDDDLWMYMLYVDGSQVGQFNPVPDYWDENISEAEFEYWKGDADIIARHWPSVTAEEVKNYLVRWNVFDDTDDAPKAYPKDTHTKGDFWQFIDFFDKLGLVYPIDERGESLGIAYRYNPAGKGAKR